MSDLLRLWVQARDALVQLPKLLLRFFGATSMHSATVLGFAAFIVQVLLTALKRSRQSRTASSRSCLLRSSVA